MQNTKGGRPLALIAFLVLAAGIVAALVAQFLLDSLADRGDLFHQLQHGLLFAGGAAVGAAGLALYRHGQQPA